MLSLVGGGAGAGLGALGSLASGGGLLGGVITSLAVGLGGSSVLMGLLTGVLASAFLVRIGATLCLGDNMAENEVLHNGVCRVVLDAARDFIENIDKNDNAGKKFCKHDLIVLRELIVSVVKGCPKKTSLNFCLVNFLAT